MAAAANIADKIQNDFLNCKICLNTFKQPKMLPCLHTYCQECLENLTRDGQRIRCPECRKVVNLSGGVSELQTNFHINGLLDIFQSAQTAEVTCDLCPAEQRKKNSAVVKCAGCSGHMCQTCGVKHRSAHPSHVLVNLAGASLGESDAERLVKQKICCQTHPKDKVCFYCSTCERAICFKCRSQSCSRHRQLGLVEAAEDKKATVRSLLERLGGDIQLLAQREGDLDEAMDKMKAVESSIISNIENALTQILNTLFKQGDTVKKTVSDHVKKQQEAFEAAKSKLQLQKEKAQGTKEFCARAVATSDAKAILCLPSIMEDQISALQALGSVDVSKPSPQVTVNKSIKEMISQRNLFNITFGEEPALGLQPSPLQKRTQANPPPAQPREWVIQKYYFDTNLDSDLYDPKLTGICTSHYRDIIIVDEQNSVLKVYANDGVFDMTISLDEDDDPCSVAACGDIIACSVKHRLHFLEMGGILVRKLLLRGSESTYPIAAYKDQYVAVSEGTLCSISLYDVYGHAIARVKPQGYDGIRFLFIAVNSEEEFIVSDCGKKCVVIFNRSAEVLTIIDESYVNGLQLALNPFSICVDRNDNIYVTEPSRILLFSPTGIFKDQLLNAADGLHKPRVITVDQDDNLIVSQGNGFVTVYNLHLDQSWGFQHCI
ncbi:E3 ubiquitin-protein ligase TRIM56-like [Scyliorhinus canicula]|uniref:E3 ubiquitin-protein ligase TRIM56-like n=1 Tax=Scyliorhinus canicula TaxID=7830 RepID=UPI0018F37DF2|nr:E3 ubiquitin-protein ligase TRIM56-like [Scyliorhinus canicula]